MRRLSRVVTRHEMSKTKAWKMFAGLTLLAVLYMYRTSIFGRSIAQMGPPTLYEYYSAPEGEEIRGLEARKEGFFLNGKPITILSGAMHYFRVHPQYWRDRLRKMRAGGLVAVETYVAWNLHEPYQGVYDFGDGNNDFSEFLDLRAYIKMAQEEDLLVILRPGPYICSEWDFGGMPSYLLRDKDMAVRTSYKPYVEHAVKYLDQVLSRVSDLQFIHGGPIIAFQIENEYGSLAVQSRPDPEYLYAIYNNMLKNDIKGLFFTSDSPKYGGTRGTIKEALQTANFQNDGDEQLPVLMELQPDKPLMVMEFWSGWFDHWLEPEHHVVRVEDFERNLKTIFSFMASVNFYMYHGGTNFGFMNGANSAREVPHYAADVTSYDYDALLSEAGDYTEKYHLARKMIANYNTVETYLPPMPQETIKRAYDRAKITHYISFADLLKQIDDSYKSVHDNPISMEMLPINGNSGQSYGFVVYRKRVQGFSGHVNLKITGYVRDMAYVLVDGKLTSRPITSKEDLLGFGYWERPNQEMPLTLSDDSSHLIEIIVENLGRINFGTPEDFEQKKGIIDGSILLNGINQTGWEIVPLELKNKWVESLTGWKPFENGNVPCPAMFKAEFEVPGVPADTFIDTYVSAWRKGVVFVNGFNIGRYYFVGPQGTLFVPAPLLKSGVNTIIIFELYEHDRYVSFSKVPRLDKPDRRIHGLPDFKELLIGPSK